MDLFRTNYKEYDIDYIMSYICRPEVKESASQYLIDNDLKINNKIFLTMFYIYGYRDLLDIDYMDEIYIICKNMYSNFTNNTLENSLILKYNNAFLEWQRMSHNKLVTELLIQYFDIKNTITRITREDINVTIDQLTEQLLIVKNRIVDNNGLEILNRMIKKQEEIGYSQITRELYLSKRTGFEYVGDQFEIIAKKAFWDSFKIDSFGSILHEIKNKYKSIIPNRTDIHEKIDNDIDVDFITQQIIHTNYNYSSLINLIFNYIKDIDSSIGQYEINTWLDNWNEINKFQLNVSEIMPYVLRDIINKLDYLTLITNEFRSEFRDEHRNELKNELMNE